MSSNQSNKPPTKPAAAGTTGKPSSTVPGLGSSGGGAARPADKSGAASDPKASPPDKPPAKDSSPRASDSGPGATPVEQRPKATLLGYATPATAEKLGAKEPAAADKPSATKPAPDKPADKAAVKSSGPRAEPASQEAEAASAAPASPAATPPVPPSRAKPGRAAPPPPTRGKLPADAPLPLRPLPPPPGPPPVRRSTPPPPPKRTSVPPPPPQHKAAPPADGLGGEDRPDAPPGPGAEPQVSAPQSLIDTCKAELGAKPEPVRAAKLHYEIARAESEPKAALEHYRKALELLPEHLPSMRGARRLLLQLGDVPAALPLFDAEIELTADPQRCALLHYAKGRALEDIANDVKAARGCFAQAAALDESNPAVLKALQHCELIAEDWANLERAREHEANAVADDPAHRAALLVDRARMLETRIKDVESATEVYEMALALDGTVVGALAALKRLLHAQKRWRDLCAVLEREAEQATDADAKAMALFRISRIQSERLGAEREAIEALVRALRARPNDQLIVEELVRLYEPTDDTAGLARALEMLAKCLPEGHQRLSVLMRIGELYELRHGDDEKAIHWYEAARVIDAAYSPVVNALDALYSQHERWDALMAVRLAEADACTESLRRAAAHARVADILETHLGRADEAAAQHARALSLAPDLESSFKALTRIYQRAGRHRDLVELYSRAIDRARDDEVVIAYLYKIGLLYEDALNAPGLAIQAYQRILRLRPDAMGAVHALQRAAESSMHHDVLVEALEREAELCKDRPRILSLLHRAGDVLADDVRDRDAALARYRKVLKLDGRYVPALASLGRLFHKMGRFRDMLQVQEQELEVTPEVQAKVALLVSMADTARNKLGDDERAIGYFRKAVELDAKHVPGLHALEQLLYARREWAGLVKVLEAELAGLDDPDGKARTAYRLGEVNEVHLRKLGAATAAYAQAVQAVPDHRPSRDAIARVQTELGSWRELVRTLEQEAVATSDGRLAIEALGRAGDVHRELLNQPADAIASYEEIITRDPENIAALLGLEALYRRATRWDDLAAVYGMQARVLKDKRARVAALEALGRLLAAKLPDREDELRKTYAAILSADPGNPLALEGLERVALRQGDRDLLADIDSRSTKAETDPLMVAAHFTRLGQSLEAGSTAAALAAYRSALQRDPDSLAAIRGMARVADKRGDAPAAVEAARREATWTRDGRRAADLLVRSAMVRVQQLNDREGAVEDAQQALQRCPEHAGAAYRLMELLLWADQTDQLIEALSAAASAVRDNKRRQAQLWQTVANLYADHQDNVPAGVAALKRALEAQPGDVTAMLRLAELYGRDTQWDEAAQVLARVVHLEPERKVTIDAHLGLSRIYLEHRPDRSAALRHVQAVLTLEPKHREALGTLLELQAQGGDVEQAREAAQRLVEASTDAASRAHALLQLGRMELRLGHRRTAAEALRASVALDGPTGDAAHEYKRELGDEEPWKRYLDVLAEHLRLAEAGEIEGADLPATYLEMARVQHAKLHLTTEAFETLRVGLRRTGENATLGLELAQALARAGRHPESVAEYQRLLRVDPGHVEAWRGLVSTLQEQGRPSEASVAAAGLIVLGVATSVEQTLATQRKTRPGWARPGSCNPQSLLAISAANLAEESLLAPLLGALAEALGKIHQPHVERLGLGSRDRVPERADHPLRMVGDRLAEVFGIERYDMYVYNPQLGHDVLVDLSAPPTLLVPSFVPELSEAQQVFLLGRAFLSAARGLHPVLRLSLDELQQAIIVGARHAAPTFGTGWYDEGEISTLSKKVGKAISRKNRRLLEEAAQHYVAGKEIDVAAWVTTVERTRARGAALLTGDLPACALLIRHLDPTLAKQEGAALVQSSDLIADLLRFWLSEPALEFRRFIGVL